jgi:hypothetical protein
VYKNTFKYISEIFKKGFVVSKNCRIFAPAIERSIVTDKKLWPIRLSVRTPDFHSGKRGSTPLWATKKIKVLKVI